MGQLTDVVLGSTFVLAFVMFGAMLYSAAVSLGGYTSAPDFPLGNSINQYQNESESFRNDLMQSVVQSQQTDTSLPFGDAWTLAGTAIIKSVTFSVSSLQLMIGMMTTGFLSVSSYFLIPSWVLGIGITMLTVVMAYAIVSVITRSNA